ncbi:MAG: AsmA family protein [Candidatus Aminicenantes bacterium]
MKKKKIIKGIGIGIAVIIMLLIAVSLFIYFTVDKSWVEEQMAKSLSRKVIIGNIQFSPFAAVAGIGIKNVVISDRMERERISELSEVPEESIFIRLDSGRLGVKLLPLLSRNLEVQEFLLTEPEIRVIRFADGSFNFSDLLQEEKAPVEEPLEEPGEPLREVTLSRIAIEDGRVLFTDRMTDNIYEIGDFELTGEGIGTDPAGLNLQSGFRAESRRLGGASFAENIQILLETEGQFESLLSGRENPIPPFRFIIRTPEGRAEGFKIFERLKNVSVLKEYFGGLDFLDEDLVWKKGSVIIAQKKGTVEFSDGELRVRDYRVAYEGLYQMTGSLEVRAALTMPRSAAESLRDLLRRNLNTILTENLKKRIDIEELTTELMRPMMTEDGGIRFVFQIEGTPSDPSVGLIEPDLPDFGEALIRLAGEEARTELRSFLESLPGKIWKEKKKKVVFNSRLFSSISAKHFWVLSVNR